MVACSHLIRYDPMTVYREHPIFTPQMFQHTMCSEYMRVQLMLYMTMQQLHLCEQVCQCFRLFFNIFKQSRHGGGQSALRQDAKAAFA